MSGLLHKVGGLVAHTLAPGTPEAVRYHDEQTSSGSAAGQTSTLSEQYTSYSDQRTPDAAAVSSSSRPVSPSSSTATGPAIDSGSSAPLPHLDALDRVGTTNAREHTSGGEVPPADALAGGSAIENEIAKMEARTKTF